MYIGKISNSLYDVGYLVLWLIKCMNYKYTEIWKCIFLIHLMLSKFVFTLYQYYPLLYNQNLYSYTKWTVSNKHHKFKIGFLTHAYITQHILVNSVILPPSVAPIVHLRQYVCDGTVDDIIVIVLYRSAVNVSLSSLLQCALSHLKPRIHSRPKPIDCHLIASVS